MLVANGKSNVETRLGSSSPGIKLAIVLLGAACASVLSGCYDGDEANSPGPGPAGDKGSARASEPESLHKIVGVLENARAPSAPDPAQPRATVPIRSRSGTNRPEAATGCESVGNCAYATYPKVETEADCACPLCPSEVETAISRTEFEERRAAFRTLCRDWSRTNACPPRLCSQPPKLTCSDDRCTLAAH